MKEIVLNENANVHPWSSNAHNQNWANEERNLREQIVTLVTWQWDNNPDSILNAMKFWAEDETVALDLLVEGQEGEWKEQYQAAAQWLPDFWKVVFNTPWLQPDFDELEVSLRWQARINWESLWNSWNAWDSDPSSQNIWAYYYLLLGQRSNPQALENYRACWYKDKNRVMAIVKELA